MNKAGVAALVVVLGYLAPAVSSLYASRHLMEPLHICGQFVGADRAMAHCGEPEPGQRKDFARNLGAVRHNVQRDLEQNHPEKALAAVSAMLAELTQAREAEVDALIAAQGCAGKDVQMLMRLYALRARLKRHAPFGSV
jgi:hypothetical protein